MKNFPKTDYAIDAKFKLDLIDDKYKTENEIADDPAQHKQSHVLELMDAGEYTGNIVALPNNRVRVTHPAWFETGEGPPDFMPNQRVFHSKQETEYVWDTQRVFNNLYAKEE